MKLESAAGILLLIAALIALLVANSPLSHLYDLILETTVAVQVGALVISKPLLLWINDGLMAVFFFLIGLEIKREIMEGELSSPAQVMLPGMGALGGMAVPASIYVWLNWGDQIALDGWAIPVATDIAFALALLSAFGTRVPITLKVFLLTLAIFDDLAAIAIIALFYSQDLSLHRFNFWCCCTRSCHSNESHGRHTYIELRAAWCRTLGRCPQIRRPRDAGGRTHCVLCPDA